jgi:hypothetical protein
VEDLLARVLLSNISEMGWRFPRPIDAATFAAKA